MANKPDPAPLAVPNVSPEDTTIIGIDPGAKGGLAVLRNGKLLGCIDMPAEEVAVGRTRRLRVSGLAIVTFFRQFQADPVLVFQEDVNGGPRDGGGAAFVFGRSVGTLDGVLETLGFRVIPAHPTVWKRAVGLQGKDKGASVLLAERLFPAARDKFRGPRGGGVDGRAEAALIAWYGWTRLRPHAR